MDSCLMDNFIFNAEFTKRLFILTIGVETTRVTGMVIVGGTVIAARAETLVASTSATAVANSFAVTAGNPIVVTGVVCYLPR